MSKETISMTNVRKSYGSLVAVDNISLSVGRGEIFGLLGPNGAGKTTVIRMIMDIIRPDSGRVEIFGGPLKEEAKERIGYLPEERGLYTRQKVFSILVYFGRLKGMKKQAARQRAEFWLERLKMTGVKDKRVAELSKGNQQKVQLIATLIADPEIIVLDEPLSGLDPVGARTVTNLIRELAASGKTVVLSSHQMGILETLCQRVLMIYKGKSVFYGDLGEIKRQHSDEAVLVKSTADYTKCSLVAQHKVVNGATKIYLKDGVHSRDLLGWLFESGATVTSFEQATAPLEDIFIRVVEEKNQRGSLEIINEQDTAYRSA